MTHPRIKFRKSAIQDLKTLLAFTQEAKYDNGRNLDWAVFSKYPQFKMYFDENNHYKIKNGKALRSFIKKTYHRNGIRFDHALTQHEKRWKKIALNYFTLVDNLFNHRKWPQGKYIAFGTIWGMFPRFLDTKTFQIPYYHRTPRYVPVVIAHELLHFMFYDYFYKRYPKYNRSKYNFFVWHVSEIFNTFVQNSPEWLRSFKLKSLSYPEHEKIVKKLSRALYRRHTWNLDELVDKIIKEVQVEKFAT